MTAYCLATRLNNHRLRGLRLFYIFCRASTRQQRHPDLLPLVVPLLDVRTAFSRSQSSPDDLKNDALASAARFLQPDRINLRFLTEMWTARYYSGANRAQAPHSIQSAIW